MLMQLATVAGGLFVGLVAIAIVYLLGMRAKSPLVLNPLIRLQRAIINPKQMRSAGTPGADASVKQGRWERMRFLGVELFGKTLGVLGIGKIGFRVALRAKAFGMNILAYDPYLTRHSLNVTETGAELVDLDTLLSRSDFITVHLPLTQETKHMLNEARLSKMKPTAYLVNTSRGPVINEADLYKILKERIIAGAALDVREKEPPGDSPLHQLDNILLTPHVAGLTYEAQDKVTDSVGEDVDRVLSGLPALRYVNFPRPRK